MKEETSKRQDDWIYDLSTAKVPVGLLANSEDLMRSLVFSSSVDGTILQHFFDTTFTKDHRHGQIMIREASRHPAFTSC